MRELAWAGCAAVLALAILAEHGAAQTHYFKASNTQPSARFGDALDFDGLTLVVGAARESSGAAGVDGDQRDSSAPSAGAAYVFVRSGDTWVQQAYLKASNTGADDRFGSSVCLYGDTIVVGAPLEDSGSVGVGGDQADESSPSAGAVYVFVRTGTMWSQQAYLKASNPGAGDHFGFSLSLEHDTLVVGAYGESSAAKGVDGDQQDDSAVGAGAAYVFRREGTSWRQEAYLKASNTTPDDRFGHSLSLSEDTLIIGAPFESMGAPGINGDEYVVGPGHSGAAYIFRRVANRWGQEAFVKSSHPGTIDELGWSVSIRGDTVAVGAAFESLGPDLFVAGAAYVFTRDERGWTQQAYLNASNPDVGDAFGGSVAVGDELILVGASQEDGGGVGLNPDQGGDIASSGAVYVFALEGDSWSQLSYAKATNTGGEYYFGGAVDVVGDVIVIGSWGERSASAGVDGTQADDGLIDAGAAYLYDLGLTPWLPVGSPIFGAQGWPALAGEGPALPASACALALSNAALDAPALLLIALESTPMPFKGGTLVAAPVVWPLAHMTDAAGTLSQVFHWPPIPSGLVLHLQYAIADPTAVYGVALSNALRVDVP